ncbi:hypothetical protein EPR50_G00121050 [Perca flavescens]|uniref:Uncharacterized protein n=1 Tax=Perca flavescens TaxID=8167 RepID=A0A484CWP7_PERFV|nr:hypothetical protein EPR50_G00121050 [Perca flavescens]
MVTLSILSSNHSRGQITFLRPLFLVPVGDRTKETSTLLVIPTILSRCQGDSLNILQALSQDQTTLFSPTVHREANQDMDLVLVQAKDRDMDLDQVLVQAKDGDMDLDQVLVQAKDWDMDLDQVLVHSKDRVMDLDQVLVQAYAMAVDTAMARAMYAMDTAMATGTGTGMVTGMSDVTRKEGTLGGPPAAPAAVTRTR